MPTIAPSEVVRAPRGVLRLREALRRLRMPPRPRLGTAARGLIAIAAAIAGAIAGA